MNKTGRSELAAAHDLQERTAGALVEAAYGFRLTHASYKAIMAVTAGETVSSLTTSRDLRSMVEAKLLRPIGQTRGRYYVGEPVLLAERRRIQSSRAPKETSDPFVLAAGQLQLRLPTT